MASLQFKELVPTFRCSVWPTYFIRSSVPILAITGSAKVLSALGTSGILTVADPITGIKFRLLMLIVGVTELIIAAYCALGKKLLYKLGMTAWLATVFLLYRLGLVWIGYHRPCRCLGSLTDMLHISAYSADKAMRILLAYLLLGSCTMLVLHYRIRKGTPCDVLRSVS